MRKATHRGGSDPAADRWINCEVCGRHPFDCTCRPCPECWESGNPTCYIPGRHAMVRPAKPILATREDVEAAIDSIHHF